MFSNVGWKALIFHSPMPQKMILGQIVFVVTLGTYYKSLVGVFHSVPVNY